MALAFRDDDFADRNLVLMDGFARLGLELSFRCPAFVLRRESEVFLVLDDEDIGRRLLLERALDLRPVMLAEGARDLDL